MDNHPKCKATLKDVRLWLEKVDAFNIPDDHVIEDGNLSIYINVHPSKVENILCGEHMAYQEYNDVIITTHECPAREQEGQHLDDI